MKNIYNLEELSTLLELLAENDVTDFELELGEEKLKLRRGPAVANQREVFSGETHLAPRLASHADEQPEASANKEGPKEPHLASPLTSQVQRAVVVEAQQASFDEIKSPMVGTFYRRPSPDASPFVGVGDNVKKGDVLCIVEAMKLMNEIESELDGQVLEVCLDDGQMVEYGEVLFKIEPSSA